MIRYIQILMGVVLATVITVAPFRLFDADVKVCTYGDGQAKFDACTRLIESTRWYHLNNGWAFNNRGNASQDKGDFQRALADYQEAIWREPTRADMYYGRGNAYFSLTNYELAIVDYSRALAGYDFKKYPRSHKTDYLNSRGDAFRLRGDLALALADYSEAIRWDAGQTDGYYNRGLVYRAMKDQDRAIADYSEAILRFDARRTPIDHKWKYLSARAVAYKMKGQFALALADYNTLIDATPSETDAYYNRGLVYLLSNDIDHAVADFSHAISGFDASKYPVSYKRDYLNKRGEAYQAKGELSLATADYDQAIRLDANFSRAKQNRAKAIEMRTR